MPMNASAKKRVKRNGHRAVINKNRVSDIRTYLKKVEAALTGGDAKSAEDALKAVQPKLDRGVARGVMKKNVAARKMSRLNARIKKLKAA